MAVIVSYNGAGGIIFTAEALRIYGYDDFELITNDEMWLSESPLKKRGQTNAQRSELVIRWSDSKNGIKQGELHDVPQ